MKIVILDGHAVNPGDLSWKPLQALGDLEVFERTSESEIVARARDAAIQRVTAAFAVGETLQGWQVDQANRS